MNTRRAAFLVLTLLALRLTAQEAVPAVLYYRSDSVGLALEPLPGRQKDEPWLLQIERRGEREVRTLYEAGEERRRWESEPRSERILEEGLLVEERSFDVSGRLLEERFFRDGKVELRSVYRYASRGLSLAETYDGQGNLVFRDRYAVSPRGGLRRVLRETLEGASQSLALFQAEGRLYEERHEGGGRRLINHIDAYGRLASQEVWQGKELVERLELAYAERSALAQSSERSVPATDTRVSSLFDGEGRLLNRVVRRKGSTVEEWSYQYDAGGNRSQASRRSAQGLEQWNYSYGDEGRLWREEYRVRGQVEKVSLYGEEDTRIEELYRGGVPFLRVTYRGGRRVREQFLVDGEVLRTREFEDEP